MEIERLNIVIATAPLINAYLHSLIDSLENWKLIEIQEKQVVYDRQLVSESFVFNSKFERIKKLRRAKGYLAKILRIHGESNVHFYFTHAANPITNWIVHHTNCPINVIPDGVLNYINSDEGLLQTKRQKINTQVASYLITGKAYRLPMRDIYSSGFRVYDACYFLTEKCLIPPKCGELKLLKIKAKIGEKEGALFLGQYAYQGRTEIYEKHVREIIQNEISSGHQIEYRPHPNEIVGGDLREFFSRNDIVIQSDNKPLELQEVTYARYLSISSSGLISMKIINPNAKCIAFPINFNGLGEETFFEQSAVFRKMGIEVNEK